MVETLAATWWVWLLLSLVSFLAVAINAFLITYGTAIDVAELAYQATKLEQKDLPPNPIKGNKEEWKEGGGKTLDVALFYGDRSFECSVPSGTYHLIVVNYINYRSVVVNCSVGMGDGTRFS